MMKSSKPSRTSLPSRSRSSRSLESQGKVKSPTTSKSVTSTPTRNDSYVDNGQENMAKVSGDSKEMSPILEVLSRESSSDVEDMKRRINEAIAQKHRRLAGSSTSPLSPARSKPAADLHRQSSSTSTAPESSSDESVTTSTNQSQDSSATIKAPADATPGSVRTPSYPFPRMNLQLNRGFSNRSGPTHRPFTLLSPTNENPMETKFIPLTRISTDAASSEMSTPMNQSAAEQGIVEDPNFPTPDLYDMILMLTSEPGLDMWWANVTEILTEAYGAERATLAVPGDVTDLENVPWGQKATYNIWGTDSVAASNLESSAASEANYRPSDKQQDIQRRPEDQISRQSQRPALISRHSIAGAVPESSQSAKQQRPTAPIRAISNMSSLTGTYNPSNTPLRTLKPPTLAVVQDSAEDDTESLQHPQDHIEQSGPPRCLVFKSIHPLETEVDPLLIRTGVSALFGRRRPIVLTRAYSDGGSEGGIFLSGTASTDDSKNSKVSDRLVSIPRAFRTFDEYEQPEPSPWSQSPSPSPAARPDPEESPFFTTPAASVDETAFEQNPPLYDYAASANQPLSAIGADSSKTLVHIPLIQPVPARSIVTSSLRFPVAILSFLTPLNPYPRNLRHSLAHLLPHLASSYSLAQQYSSLHDRIRGGLVGRHGAAFGLGGTFSDEGSELELVAELSGQVAQEKDKLKSPSQQSDLSSMSDLFVGHRDFSSASADHTPLYGHMGLIAGMPATPGRSGFEMVDSYFSAKKQKSGLPARSPGTRVAKEDLSESKKKSTEKMAAAAKPTFRKSPIFSSKTTAEQSPATPVAATASPLSETGSTDLVQQSPWERAEMAMRRQSQIYVGRDESEKPLPELIASLMLNSVPLQLFLAKPGSGDLVWTNRKFDAFRSQGEGRVRDPWKNVHPADRNGLAKLWHDALKTGAQFTHYIRVKRFNSDSDYRWFVFRASTLLASHGSLLYWIGSFLDVHEQYIKNLEASEREATVARDAKIRALADAIPQVLFEAVEGEGIVSVNQQWHAFSGQTLDDARGLGFAKHVHRDDLHKCGLLSPMDLSGILVTHESLGQSDSSSSSSSNRTAGPLPVPGKTLFAPDASSLQRMLQTGSVAEEKDENGRTSYLTEIRLRSKRGEYRWFLVRLVRVESDLLNNGRASWYGTCTDIDIRKALERELNQANQKVHSEMESKTKFFANMSHEIRTPLNGILGSMPWLVESTLDHDQRRTVDTIQNSANNLRELVDNILDVTKVEAGKMTLLPKWFNVRTLCEEVVDTVSSRAIERGLELNYTLDPDVPPTVKGDAFRVRQILLNLMGNSVKFTEQGEIYMRCRIYKSSKTLSSPPATSIHLGFDVTDTGRGFNQDDFQRLFQQFGQIGGGSNHDAGSGLGLFLSKQLVEMHGGELSVKSQAGEGSTFSFHIKVELPGADFEGLSPMGAGTRSQQLRRASLNKNSRSRSDSKTPTLGARRSSVQGAFSPSLARQISSPESQSPVPMVSPGPSPAIASPPMVSSEGSGYSVRSNSAAAVPTSSMSSMVETPESGPSRGSGVYSEKDVVDPQSSASLWMARGEISAGVSSNSGTLTPDIAHPTTYSIVVICPADNARAAIQQHIEYVVPHQIAANVTAVADMGAFANLMPGAMVPTLTHVVLDLPHSSDIMLFMRQLLNVSESTAPVLVVITDHYQKRDIMDDFTTYTASGRKAFLVHKPVKPSVFSMIFDPSQLRYLSRDRAREGAQISSEGFKNVANMVKDTIGNRAFRILLVEDSDVNRMVIMRYLKKVALDHESARDGQECTDMVFAKPHDYYSLIICDIQMPKKNGYQACREIREWEQANRYTPVPIMALTANAMPEEKAVATAAGFTDYLTKPVEFNTLGMMMMNLLGPRASQSTLVKSPG